MADDIRPPMPTDELRDEIKRMTVEYGEQLRKIVASHLQKKRSELDCHLASLDHTDVDRAKLIADKYATTQLGKRLPETRRRQLLDEAVNVATMPPPAGDFIMVNRGTKRNASISPVISPIPVPTRNRFDLLNSDADIEINDDDDDDDDVTVQIPPPNMTPKRQRSDNSDGGSGPSTSQSSAKRPLLRPSTTTMRTQAGVHVYSGDKDDWTVTPRDDTTTIVIGDSNMKRVTSVPGRWDVFALPGATPAHAAKAVRRLQKTPGLQHVIVQVGINYRNRPRGDYIRQEYDAIVDDLRKLGVRYTFSGISTAPTLTASDRDQCRYINDVAREAFGRDNYIPPLSDDECLISPGDKYGIHHTDETIGRVMTKMIIHDDFRKESVF
ncbi:hypothetical protein HC928_11935 [bacterium]|nr:hypothetical protein [bacterium]